jgi:hypothetical protein
MHGRHVSAAPVGVPPVVMAVSQSESQTSPSRAGATHTPFVGTGVPLASVSILVQLPAFGPLRNVRMQTVLFTHELERTLPPVVKR